MKLKVENADVQTHVRILQDIIKRMASNSASCKTWCVTIIAAILVLAIDKEKPSTILAGFLVAFLFFVLDAYYLSLERDFREKYNRFVRNLHDDKAKASDVYDLAIPNDRWHRGLATICACFSFSVIGFYGVLVLGLFVVKSVLLT